MDAHAEIHGAGLTGPFVLAASVLWLPYQAYSLLVRSAAQSSSPLAEISELLLLLLAFHSPAQGTAVSNPFRRALQLLQVRTMNADPTCFCALLTSVAASRL